jgi:hypothetical protein
LQLVENNGVDYAAETATGSSDADGEGSLGAEVLWNDGNADDENAASAYTDAEALCKEKLVVGTAQRGHHQAEDHHEGTKEDDGLGMATIEERASEYGDAAGEESLDGANPGYRAVVAIGN